jgi:hypothetical protein
MVNCIGEMLSRAVGCHFWHRKLAGHLKFMYGLRELRLKKWGIETLLKTQVKSGHFASRELPANTGLSLRILLLAATVTREYSNDLRDWTNIILWTRGFDQVLRKADRFGLPQLADFL